MTLQSLVAEITAVLPRKRKVTKRAASETRLLVLFEDTLGALRVWQNELLKIDGAALRKIGVNVACVPSDHQPPLLNGRPAELPVKELRSELQGEVPGKFEVVLLDFRGDVILRSDGPVTIEQLTEAVKGNGRRHSRP